MAKWLAANVPALMIWAGAICTFAIYSVLYNENKIYRLFEHIFIGLGAGYGVYVVWSEVLGPKWWEPMVKDGQWAWIFAAVIGSMFYFIYSKRQMWISRVIFGLFMGLAAGGMFREFYELYFPQMAASMKPVAGPHMTAAAKASTLVFYVILFASMSYFFFSFEHKSKVMLKTASAGRWFLMIGFGAIFGATVMGRMTLFIGRLNFLISDWGPQLRTSLRHPLSAAILVLVAAALVLWAGVSLRSSQTKEPAE